MIALVFSPSTHSPQSIACSFARGMVLAIGKMMSKPRLSFSEAGRVEPWYPAEDPTKITHSSINSKGNFYRTVP